MLRTLRIGALAAAVLLLAGCTQDSGGGSGADGAHETAEQTQSAEQVPSASEAPSSTSGAPSAQTSGQPGTPSGNPAAGSTSAPEQTVVISEALAPVFGFADAAGTRILVPQPEEDHAEGLKRLDTAIGSSGRTLSVKLEQWQPGTGNSNGRDLALNLANIPGYLFIVDGGGAVPDDTYALVDSSAFSLEALLPIRPSGMDGERLDAEDSTARSIAAAKGRDIHAAWKLADLGEDRTFYLVQFVRQDKDMLFSLALQAGEDLIFMDYSAVIQDNEYSVWRVDDGGEVHPQMFSLLFAARTPDGILLAVNWRGAEGINSFLLKQEGTVFKELEAGYSRYTSPI
ncbi:hypothetical protein [Paenibacillus tengchongensis]|uniref:hypothetical protein n=1 Tax=Paenibacillus tengchongensis TaxID=2608684 RepID=UPI00124E7245|nr:hypothetical protein [Paenibacillus tengchongensis]